MTYNTDVLNKITAMTTQKIAAIQKNVYKETLRELLNIFGGIYYTDGNNNLVRVKCVHGKTERAIGRDKKDNTLILPYLTVTEISTSNAEQRLRYNNMLVSESLFDVKKNRATRVLSLTPRPVNLIYRINIWAKYQADLDIIRSAIFLMFNPGISIQTRFSDYTIAFLENESDEGNIEAQDTTDRVLKKSVTIRVETYLPSPKFMFTNTGSIESFNVDYQLFDYHDDIETDDPIETISQSDEILR